MHTPLAVITKAAAVLSDDVFTDMIPVAWELLIETDQELAAAAGNLSLIISFSFILQFLQKKLLLIVLYVVADPQEAEGRSSLYILKNILLILYYLRQGGYVLPDVCLSLC